MSNKTFILVDENVTTHGWRLLLSGGNLEQFKKNPVGFYQHGDYTPPILRWENIREEDGKLLADAVFDMEDDFAAKIAGKVERDFIRMASVSVVPIKVSSDPMLMLPGQTDVTLTEWRLREVSIVPIGGCHNALRLYDEGGNELSLDKETILRLSDKNTNPKIQKNMTKLNTALQLADNATEEQQVAAVQALADKTTAVEAENKVLADKLKAFEDAEVAKRTQEAVTLTDAAIKDGRLNAKGPNGEDNRASTLALFDKDFAAAKAMLEAIPTREALTKRLNDESGQSEESEWDKRMEEINKQ